VIHAIGPVVAVSVVAVLPIIWQHFVDLDHGPAVGSTGSPYPGPTPVSYWADAGPTAAPTGMVEPSVDPALLARAVELIRAGRLPPQPSATKLQPALGCGMDAARQVRDALRDDRAGAP
jgi:hypothetical protein